MLFAGLQGQTIGDIAVNIARDTDEAAGETAGIEGLPTELDFSLSKHPWPEGKKEGWMTDVDGVFATGGKSVVYAMAAGSKVADAIETYVARKQKRPVRPRPDPFGGASPPKLPDGYGGPTWHL